MKTSTLVIAAVVIAAVSERIGALGLVPSNETAALEQCQADLDQALDRNKGDAVNRAVALTAAALERAFATELKHKANPYEPLSY